MLIEFNITNFRSIRDRQTLTLAASSQTELEQNTFCPGESDLRLVRTAVIYGPNAGGKSNLLSALLFMRWFILFSAKESQQGEEIPIESFRFDNKTAQQPSEFEVIFIKNDIKFQYGFVADENRIFEEWLFAYPLGKSQQWFSRKYDETKNDYVWKFSRLFKCNKEIPVLTRGNVLFLSNAVKLDNKQLIPIFSWFQKDLILIDSPKNRGINYSKTIDLINTSEGKQKVIEFMHAADQSISDIIVDTQKFSEENLPADMPQAVKDYIKKDIVEQKLYKISFEHTCADKRYLLKIGDQSDGTVRLFKFNGLWIDALQNGRILIVDELDNSMHPLVVRFLVELITNPKYNKNNAQLIFSTHDTSLLDNEIFRRDQIWFVEKDKYNSTQLYPLLDFSPRKNEALGRGYLQGRYGALPYIGEWKF